MEGKDVKMTNCPSKNDWRLKSVCSVAYLTQLITGCISAPSKVNESFGTSSSKHYSSR